MHSLPRPLAYFLVSFPNPTQTFIQREIRGLLGHGIPVVVMTACSWGSDEPADHPQAPAILRLNPTRAFLGLLHGLLRFMFSPRLWPRALTALVSYRPRSLGNLLATLGGIWAGLVFSREVDRCHAFHVHAGWAALPATAAWTAARLHHLRFSFGAHAYDIHRHGGDGFLPAKIHRAAFVHTTTEAALQRLRTLAPGTHTPLVLVRRGLDPLPDYVERTSLHAPLRILSVGRLVPKKGHEHQLRALAEMIRRGLDAELHWAGDGPLRSSLETLALSLGVGKQVVWHGAIPFTEVSRLHQTCDLFWHTGVIDAEGDRDGLPNVVPEAMAAGLPVLASPQPGVMEAITHGVTGWIADPEKTGEWVDAVRALTADGQKRIAVTRAARSWVETHFQAAINTGLLAARFRDLAR